MKKKLLIALLAITSLVCCSICLAGCNEDKPSESVWGKEYTVHTAYAVATDLGYSGTLDEFIASISGKDGKDGVDGKGITTVEINADGELIITFTDETTKNLGAISKCTHSFSDWETGVAADCTSIGYNTRTCSKCGNIDYKFIEKTGHIWDDGVVVKAASSKQTGLKIYSCTVCRTAKTEELPIVETLSEEEWKAAVRATLNSDNFSYECYCEQSPIMMETEWYEKVMVNLDKGLSYYYTYREKSDGGLYENEIYYKLDRNYKISFENYSSISGDGSYEDEIKDWYGLATVSEYSLGWENYKVKFDLDNHGYSMLESLGNWLAWEAWGQEGLKLEDAYKYFTYDSESKSFVYIEESDEFLYEYSIQFKDGYISAFCVNVKMDNATVADMIIEFSDYGTTKVEIPQEVSNKVAAQGLEFRYWYGQCDSELEIKTEYFGITVTSVENLHMEDIQTLIIPDTVTYIDGFDCSRLSTIRYSGTKAQWEAIEKRENWDAGAGREVGGYTVVCSDGEIVVQKEGKK